MTGGGPLSGSSAFNRAACKRARLKQYLTRPVIVSYIQGAGIEDGEVVAPAWEQSFVKRPVKPTAPPALSGRRR